MSRISRHTYLAKPPPSLLPNKCACGGVTWEDVSDAATGTPYARCRSCGRHYAMSRRAWVDDGAGILVDSEWVIGSMWTKSVSSTFFGKGWPP